MNDKMTFEDVLMKLPKTLSLIPYMQQGKEYISYDMFELDDRYAYYRHPLWVPLPTEEVSFKRDFVLTPDEGGWSYPARLDTRTANLKKLLKWVIENCDIKDGLACLKEGRTAC